MFIYVEELLISTRETFFIFQTVKSQLYNVLTFPEGGWLVDSGSSEADEDDDDNTNGEMSRRRKQMDDLRQLCIPKVG
jgi:nuclear pore complex protein Nup107